MRSHRGKLLHWVKLYFIAITIGIALGALTVTDPMGRLVEAQIEAEGQ